MILQIHIKEQNAQQIIEAIKLLKGVKSVSPQPNTKTMKALQESDANAKAIKLGTKKAFSNWNEAKKAILDV